MMNKKRFPNLILEGFEPYEKIVQYPPLTNKKVYGIIRIYERDKSWYKKIAANGLTPAQERAILRADADARAGKNLVGPMSVEEFKKYIDSI